MLPQRGMAPGSRVLPHERVHQGQRGIRGFSTRSSPPGLPAPSCAQRRLASEDSTPAAHGVAGSQLSVLNADWHQRIQHPRRSGTKPTKERLVLNADWHQRIQHKLPRRRRSTARRPARAQRRLASEDSTLVTPTDPPWAWSFRGAQRRLASEDSTKDYVKQGIRESHTKDK